MGEFVGHHPEDHEGQIMRPGVIILGSESLRRQEMVTSIAGPIPVECIPLARERDDPDPAGVAYGKLCDCKDIVATQQPQYESRQPLILAADTRALVLSMPWDPRIESPPDVPLWLNLGKLPDHASVQRVFHGMLEAARATGQLPQYRIVSGSVSEFGPRRLIARHHSRVVLRPEHVEALTTDSGLGKYIHTMGQVEAANEASFHEKRSVLLAKCAGIHFETFMVSGAVASIDGIPSEDPRFLEEVNQCISYENIFVIV